MIGSLVATAFWAMLPAYVPNNAAVLAGGGRPIDGGRDWRGARLLGDGKTWRGTAVGTLTGVVLALALNRIAEPASAALGVDLPTFALPAAFALAFGAMCGDIGASFLKRRSGRERGAAFLDSTSSTSSSSRSPPSSSSIPTGRSRCSRPPSS